MSVGMNEEEQMALAGDIFEEFKEINTASERYMQESSNADWNEEWGDVIGETEIMTYLEKDVENEKQLAKLRREHSGSDGIGKMEDEKVRM
eukprot:gnl/Chilomastix_caulleri/853.p1 GENE.gnl/Chilomastix_caulleri/853~~gnl/Chilomastix_caulleri/853.p1  ORF type:complete len:91 (-),score=29.17 gnl/Chilomastix_caulleri/853:529-801(-)